MSEHCYLAFDTTMVSVAVKGAAKKFYPHTVNSFSGGLFLGSEPEITDGTVDLSRPLMVPEETTITINAVANDNRTPVSIQVRGVKQYANEIRPYILDVSVNFRSRIGVALVDVECGAERFTLVLDVCPTKIGYDDEYYALVKDLQSLSRGLVFDWLRSSSFTGTRGGNEVSSDVEFLAALDYNINRLSSSLALIEKSPSRTIQRKQTYMCVDQIVNPSQAVIRSIAQGRGTGPILSLDNGSHVHERIPSVTATVGFDTPTNRWLKQRLNLTRARLARILRANQGRNADSLYGDGTAERLRSLYAELTSLSSKDFLKEVRPARGRTQPGIEVMGRAGYRTAAAIFDELDKAFVIADGVQLINSRLIAELYEEWCYLKVAILVSDLTDGALDPRDTIQITDGSLRVRFAKNKLSRISIDVGDDGMYQVAYNKEYRTLTGVQKPDIVLEVNRGLQPSTILVLDAKYRLTDKDAYGRQIPPQPPVDAINALHRYRDAIYLNERNRKIRPVVKGVMLYPPPIDYEYDHLPYWSSIEQVGIGAIPLLPGHDEYLKDFLSSALATKDMDFYKPGPSFEPYETILRHERVADSEG